MPSFDSKKRLRFVITLGTGDFDSKGSDQIILEGFRAVADITNAGGLQMGELRGRIYGVSASDMNAITSFAYRFGATLPNTCIVYAIDGTVETMVFAGNIINAWPDFNSPPDVFLHIQAQAAMINLIRAVPPRSFSGTIDVASVMSQIAASMGYAFENNGVMMRLDDVYLDSTGLDQATALARMAGIDLFIDRTTLAICPRGQPRRQGQPLPAIDNSEEIKKLLAEWKVEHDKFLILFREGQALDNAGNRDAAMEKYREAKVHNTAAEQLLARAQSLKAQERPATSTGAPVVSALTGLVGYPMFDGVYLSLRTLFNPGIIPGGTIKVESDRDRATGTWQVLSMNHRLESEKPDGAWFTSLRSMADISTITGRS